MTCCCHGFDDPCPFGWEERHVHKCLPRFLDLDGHCPADQACVGGCVANAGTVGCEQLGSDE